MIQLPNGCKCSQPSVAPKNWRTSAASVKQDWRIQYYFYDPILKPAGKLIVVKKAINEITDWSTRKKAVEQFLAGLVQHLKETGYNPISKTKNIPTEDPGKDLTLKTALQFAFKRIKITRDTALDVKSMLKYFYMAADQLTYSHMPIKEIKRLHIKLILEQIGKTKEFSANRFNKYRTYLSILFAELAEMEIIEINFIPGIKKQKSINVVREVVTVEECKVIDKHLNANYYTFWRFMHIFFQSGGRIIELLRIQAKDVILKDQVYKSVIYKGRQPIEKVRVITNDILPLWQELLKDAKPNDYIFARNLEPSPIPIRRKQITNRWKSHVKIPLGITADFYSLKHLFLDLTAGKYGIDTSQSMANHTSKLVTMKHYATGEQARELEKMKGIKVSLIG